MNYEAAAPGEQPLYFNLYPRGDRVAHVRACLLIKMKTLLDFLIFFFIIPKKR